MRIAFLSLIVLAGGTVSVSTQTAMDAPPAPPVVAEQVPTDGGLTPEAMQELAVAICKGDDGAMAALEDATERLYRGINFAKETERVLANLRLLRVTFDEIGRQAGEGNKSAVDALTYCLRPDNGHLRAFVPDALGIAAAAGHKPSMDILLDYGKHGILLSSAVSAMNKSASKGDARAVAFLSNVLSGDDTRPLWSMASTGLKAAAAGGNVEAQKALEQQARKHPGWDKPATRPVLRQASIP